MRVRNLFLLLGVWLLQPGVAGATMYDTSAASISCTSFLGTVAPKPVMTMAEQPTVLTLKGTISGCTVTGATPAGPPLQVLSAKLKAKLTVVGDASCVSLISGFHVVESLVFEWKAAAGQELDLPSTTFTIDSNGFVPVLQDIGMTSYGVFGATGAVEAGSAFGAAAMPWFLIMSAEDIWNMYGQCCTDAMSCSPVGRGIKKLHISIGQLQM